MRAHVYQDLYNVAREAEPAQLNGEGDIPVRSNIKQCRTPSTPVSLSCNALRIRARQPGRIISPRSDG